MAKFKLELEEQDVAFVIHLLEVGIKNGKIPCEIKDEKGNIIRSSNIAKEALRIDEEITRQLDEQSKVPIKSKKK